MMLHFAQMKAGGDAAEDLCIMRARRLRRRTIYGPYDRNILWVRSTWNQHGVPKFSTAHPPSPDYA